MSERHRRSVTEGALQGGLIEKGSSLDMALVCDRADAGQFAVLLHALCWVHAEGLLNKLLALNDRQHVGQARLRGAIWDLYADLNAYRRRSDPALRPTLEGRFDTICTRRTSFTTLEPDSYAAAYP